MASIQRDKAMIRKIDFLIIGAQKSGTTTLHDQLARHADIFMPKRKDIPFFIDAGATEVRERDLEAYYGACDGEDLIGGSFVHLLYHPEAPGRIRAYNPDMKLVAILRNPIDRAYSAFWFARREGYETCESFERAIDLESNRARGGLRERNELTYLAHGHYDAQLRRFLGMFDRQSIFIGTFEDLTERPECFNAQVLSWLGVEPDSAAALAPVQRNASGLPRSRLLQRVLIVPPIGVSAIYRSIVPRRARFRLDQLIVSRLRALNTRPFRYPPMRSETRERLARYFEPHNQRLARLTGLDLRGWT